MLWKVWRHLWKGEHRPEFFCKKILKDLKKLNSCANIDKMGCLCLLVYDTIKEDCFSSDLWY